MKNNTRTGRSKHIHCILYIQTNPQIILLLIFYTYENEYFLQILWMTEKKENGKSKSMEIKNSNAHEKNAKIE